MNNEHKNIKEFMTSNAFKHGLWLKTRLNQEEMDFLHQTISKENKVNYSLNLAGNISKSEALLDEENWFYEMTLKKLTEKLFYRDWNNFSKYQVRTTVDEERPLPEFEMNSFWVNYMKQHEFNPIHNHRGLFSFVIFMKIPTHWKEQHALPISANSGEPCASDFQFILGETQGSASVFNIPLCPEDEGSMVFFPAWLSHQVFPFYECEEERITISGNISLYDPNKSIKISVDEIEEKENMIKSLENDIIEEKQRLIHMKLIHNGSEQFAFLEGVKPTGFTPE